MGTLSLMKEARIYNGEKAPSSVNGSLVAQVVKRLPAVQETQVQPLGREDLLEKEMVTPPVFLPEKFHGRRTPVDYSPWCHKEWDTTE